ncbi:hypothetical protein [Enterobacter cloacae]|uniref:hypothetical protein n=1 Tax=Enterobacter cloacae TaxID=550 RepID=UPI0029316404|nr:hypothetical protein [Enterobacter cloacae]
MITEKNNVFYCDCGFSFQRGHSGAHDCADGLRNKLADSEARCAALAAENAGLKSVCEDRRTFIMNGVQLGYIQVPTVETDPALETIRVAVSPQEPTPATDAFLAEVRAAAVDEVCLKISNAIVNCYQDEQVGLDAAATICGDFAAQLRKGVPS